MFVRIQVKVFCGWSAPYLINQEHYICDISINKIVMECFLALVMKLRHVEIIYSENFLFHTVMLGQLPEYKEHSLSSKSMVIFLCIQSDYKIM
jgi:hypothetical protein